uniref:WAT1-related protein n=1 Tax=Quercus lobata TaxID=97700 RepID=A0A7N2LI81_QUELO
MHLSLQSSYSNKASRNRVLNSSLDPAIHLIASAKAWLLPMLPSSIKTSLNTLKGVAKTIKEYPSPIALTALTCLSGTLLSTIMAAIFDHKLSSWRLSWNITLLAPIYSGVAIFGITYYLQTLVSQRKGPVFMTAFRPLSTLLTAIMGLLILREALHLGSILGAMLIILGLYMTLWGKESDRKKKYIERGRYGQTTEIKLENCNER